MRIGCRSWWLNGEPPRSLEVAVREPLPTLFRSLSGAPNLRSISLLSESCILRPGSGQRVALKLSTGFRAQRKVSRLGKLLDSLEHTLRCHFPKNFYFKYDSKDVTRLSRQLLGPFCGQSEWGCCFGRITESSLMTDDQNKKLLVFRKNQKSQLQKENSSFSEDFTAFPMTYGLNIQPELQRSRDFLPASSQSTFSKTLRPLSSFVPSIT